MNWMEFVAALVHALAWPLAAVIAVFLLRLRLDVLMSGKLERLKAGPGGIEMVWRGVAEDVKTGELQTIELRESAADSPRLPKVQSNLSLRTELEELARNRPREAIMEAHGRLETALREKLRASVPAAPEVYDAVSLAGLAAAHKVINQQTLRSFEGLNVLRNLAIHSRPDDMSEGRALEYLDLADGVLYGIGAATTS